MNVIDNVIDKSCSPNQYSYKKINFREIKLISDLESWHRKLEMAIRQSIKKSFESVYLEAKIY